jgi:alpha-tubulin suppressor-like RCC1 family protein
MGMCPAQTTTSCHPYQCDSANNKCFASCAAPSDCADGYTCNTNVCTPAVKTIAVGAGHACAIIDDGKTLVGAVKCWGNNMAGQVSAGTKQTTPTLVKDLQPKGPAQSIALGAAHSCAIVANGSGEVWCWGDNGFGQLGDGTNSTTNTVQRVMNVCQVSTTSSGMVPIALQPRLQPLATSPIAAGGNSSCVILADFVSSNGSGNGACCWGENREGQLGAKLNDGTYPSENIPYLMISSSPEIIGQSTPTQNWDNITSIALGAQHGSITLLSKGVASWGAKCLGQEGTDDISATSIDQPSVGGKVYDAAGGQTFNGVSPVRSAIEVAAGDNHGCLIRTSDRSVFCWGLATHGQVGYVQTPQTGCGTAALSPVYKSAWATGVSAATHLALGANHSCALLNGGTIKCWGDNAHGQLGIGGPSTTDPTMPTISDVVDPTGNAILGNVQQIAAGGDTTCARLTDNSVLCWGRNDYGQLGVGDLNDRALPTAVQF